MNLRITTQKVDNRRIIHLIFYILTQYPHADSIIDIIKTINTCKPDCHRVRVDALLSCICLNCLKQ